MLAVHGADPVHKLLRRRRRFRSHASVPQWPLTLDRADHQSPATARAQWRGNVNEPRFSFLAHHSLSIVAILLLGLWLGAPPDAVDGLAGSPLLHVTMMVAGSLQGPAPTTLRARTRNQVSLPRWRLSKWMAREFGKVTISRFPSDSQLPMFPATTCVVEGSADTADATATRDSAETADATMIVFSGRNRRRGDEIEGEQSGSESRNAQSTLPERLTSRFSQIRRAAGDRCGDLCAALRPD